MAILLRSAAKKPAAPLLGKKPVPAATSTLFLPEEASVPTTDVNEFHFLIHGEKKIGKTTFCTVEGDVLLLTFDPLQKALAIKQAYCPDWATFEGYLKLLEARAKNGNYPYRRVVIDGADIWYRCCQTAVEKKLVVDHVSEEGWGRGWDMLKQQATSAVVRLMNLPGGCWFISHSVWREVETRDGRKIEKLLPLMKGGAEEILVGRVDGWFAYDYSGRDRILVVRGDESTGAGNRCKGRFMTPDGRPVVEIPMGSSEEDGYRNFLSAFNNQQAFATVSERDGKGAEQPPKKKLLLAKKK